MPEYEQGQTAEDVDLGLNRAYGLLGNPTPGGPMTERPSLTEHSGQVLRLANDVRALAHRLHGNGPEKATEVAVSESAADNIAMTEKTLSEARDALMHAINRIGGVI